jgi:hypothetical protein
MAESGGNLENRLKVLDVVFKGVSTLILVTGAIVGLLQYLDHSRLERVQRQKDLNTLLYKSQMDLYLNATDITAKFSQSTTSLEAETARKEFWQLYYGKLSIVENDKVKEAMIDFGRGVKIWEGVANSPDSFIAPAKLVLPEPEFKDIGRTFKDLSYSLSQRCRAHLNSSFNEELPPLSDKKP